MLAPLLKQTLLAVLAAAVSIALTALPSAAAGEMILHPYDWLLTIKTMKEPRLLRDPKLEMQPMVKLEVKYNPADDDAATTNYEKLWYYKQRPLAIERLHKFALPQGEGVAIRVTHAENPSSSAERKAAANAILRLLLDAHINKNPLITVKLPQESFNGIVAELQDQNAVSLPEVGPETPIPTTINIFLESEPPGLTKRLYYL